MTTLHLGVLDQLYADPITVDQAYASGRFSQQTTGFVAELLEEQYGVMDGFVFLHKEEIADNLAESAAGVIENIMAGGKIPSDPFAGGMAKIEDLFKNVYLQREEIVIAGSKGAVPTLAAIEGRSVRFKYRKGARRPSFIDSGLYQASFKAWID